MSGHDAYVFRLLAPLDVQPLKALQRVFGVAFNEVDTYQRAVPSDAYLAAMLAKSHFIAVTASTGDEIVGGLAAYVLDKFEQDGREIYIYDLAVAAPHRRRGIATGLINELKQVAAARDAYVIFVQADLADGPAIALYETLGASESVLHFDIAVPCSTPKS